MANKKDPLRVPIYLEDELEDVFRGLARLETKPKWRERCMFVRLLFGTGLRINEARSIRLRDVDLVKNWIVVLEGKRGADGKDKPRLVEPSPELRPHLERYVLAERAKGGPENRALFPSPSSRGTKGKPQLCKQRSVPSCRMWWHQVIAEIGVHPLSPHAARRTYATWEAKEGRLSKTDLKMQLGHSSLDVTEQYYLMSVPGSRYNKSTGDWMQVARDGGMQV
jgi:integrase